MQRPVTWNFGGAAPILHIWIYKHTNVTGASAEVYLQNTYGTFVNSMRATLNLNNVPSGQWYHWMIRPTDWTAYGSADWSDTFSGFAIGQLGTTAVSFDSLYQGAVGYPALVITFDDAYDNVFTLGYPIFQDRNAVATVFINDTYNTLTDAHIQELHGAGWVIGNHGQAHDLDGTLTEAQILSSLHYMESYLTGLGVSVDPKHVAYPNGNYSAATLAAMAAYGAKTGRTTVADRFLIQDLTGKYTNYKVPAIALSASVSLATAKSYVDLAVAEGTVLCVYMHGLVPSGATGNDWDSPDLEEFLDYAINQGLFLLTMDELYQLEYNAVEVRKASSQ